MAMRSELFDMRPERPQSPRPRSAATQPAEVQSVVPDSGKSSDATRQAPDVFVRRPATTDPLRESILAVKDLENLPPVPAGVRPMRAWVSNQTARIDAADSALSRLSLAHFEDNAVSEDDLMLWTGQVQQARATLRETRERAGLQAPVPPLDPARPAFQLTDGASKLMQTPLTSLLGVLLLPVALSVDGIDALTRPAQAGRYPETLQNYQKRLAEYEKARQIP